MGLWQVLEHRELYHSYPYQSCDTKVQRVIDSKFETGRFGQGAPQSSTSQPEILKGLPSSGGSSTVAYGVILPIWSTSSSNTSLHRNMMEWVVVLIWVHAKAGE